MQEKGRPVANHRARRALWAELSKYVLSLATSCCMKDCPSGYTCPGPISDGQQGAVRGGATSCQASSPGPEATCLGWLAVQGGGRGLEEIERSPDPVSHHRPDLDPQAVQCPDIQTLFKSNGHHCICISRPKNNAAVKHKLEDSTGIKGVDPKPGEVQIPAVSLPSSLTSLCLSFPIN